MCGDCWCDFERVRVKDIMHISRMEVARIIPEKLNENPADNENENCDDNENEKTTLQ